MKKTDYIPRLSELVSNEEVRKYIHKKYKSPYASVVIRRCADGVQFPPVNMIIDIARILGTNVDYLMGKTDVIAKTGKANVNKEKSLSDLLEMRGMTEAEFMRFFRADKKMMDRYRERLPVTRITSLVNLAEAMQVSVDFLLGCTDWENWELCARMQDPFSCITPGTAAFIVADMKVRTLAEVRDALERRDGRHCLLSRDGKTVIFPNGKSIDKDDKAFKGSFVAAMKAEV